MGFEPEIKKILMDIRPDRQTIMTRYLLSATSKGLFNLLSAELFFNFYVIGTKAYYQILV